MYWREVQVRVLGSNSEMEFNPQEAYQGHPQDQSLLGKGWKEAGVGRGRSQAALWCHESLS